MQINRNTLASFRIDFAKAVADLEKKYEVKVALGAIRYDAAQFNTRLVVTNLVKVGEQSIPANIPTRLAKYVTETFRAPNGALFRVVDYRPRSRKYPIIAVNQANGKKFKLPESWLPADARASNPDTQHSGIGY